VVLRAHNSVAESDKELFKGSKDAVCSLGVFEHLQCGLESTKLDGANLGSCWCRQRAKRFGQRELSLPYAWKTLLSVALLGLSLLFASDVVETVTSETKTWL